MSTGYLRRPGWPNLAKGSERRWEAENMAASDSFVGEGLCPSPYQESKSMEELLRAEIVKLRTENKVLRAQYAALSAEYSELRTQQRWSAQ